jgi:membrane protease subunit HflK
MYLETMQQVYSNTSKVMVDAKGQGNLLYLPLDKLMQAGRLQPARRWIRRKQPRKRLGRPIVGEAPPPTRCLRRWSKKRDAFARASAFA